MKPFKKKRIVNVDIETLNKDGYGVGSFELQPEMQREVEVPFTMPKDKVTANLYRKRSGIYQSQLVDVLQPSEDRIAPRCIHFATCGGCRWQHIPYQYQLEQKQKYVHSCFKDLLHPDLILHPIISCDPPWQYRNKMEFSFSQNLQGEQFLGLIIHNSRGKVFNVTECHLVKSWFVDALKVTREWWVKSGLEAYHLHKDKGSLRTLTLREGFRTGDRMVCLTVSGNPDYALNGEQLKDFVSVICKAIQPPENGKLSIFLRIQQIAKGSPTQFFEMLLHEPDQIRETLYLSHQEEKYELTFKISPSSFFQPNTQQAERLYSLALKMAKITKDSVVYDLFCGTGTLGICAAPYAKYVVGIELSPEGSLDARTNAKDNQLSNITILTGDVGNTLEKIQKEKSHPFPDIVMIDPPRVGMDKKAIQTLINFAPSIIVYISCNPTSQAANIAELVQNGYRLLEIQPVDQFPQTIHIENIALLERTT